MDKLLPCPYCGGKAKLIKTPNRGEFYIRCKSEDIEQLSLKPTRAEAIAAWNKRHVCDDKNRKAVYAGDEVRCVPLDYLKITHPSQGIVVWCDLIFGWTIAVGKVRYALKDFSCIELVKEAGK